MNAENIDLRPPHDRDVVVTYTRLSPGRRPKRSVMRAPSGDTAPELTLDGTEVPSIGPEDPVAFDFSAGDRCCGRDDLVEDFIDKTRRPDWLPYGLVAGSLAVIAGVGVLVATVWVATILPSGPSQSDRSGEPALALNSDLSGEPALTTGGIREIQMSEGASEAAWRSEAAPPPIPRPRPDKVQARAEPEPQATVPSPAPAPASSHVAVTPPPPAPAAVAEASGNSGADSLIISIEETLARIDQSGPATPSETQFQHGQPSPTELSVVMNQPVYPPSGDIAPPSGIGGIEPAYDVVPPPATVDGYGGYSATPVPPEPVPDFYPQAPQLAPPTPGLYPSNPYAFPPPGAIEETQVRRPGFLRRTLAKATNAVGRVFERN